MQIDEALAIAREILAQGPPVEYERKKDPAVRIHPQQVEPPQEPQLRRRRGAGDEDPQEHTEEDMAKYHEELQEELTDQLGAMTKQLKLQSVNFQESLEKDKSIMDEASEKMDENYTNMQDRQRRLKTYSKKSRRKTWLNISVMFSVAMLWLFMFFLIRLTK